MPVTITIACFEARNSTDQHSTLKSATKLQERTMTDFVVSIVKDTAQRTIEQAEVICLSPADGSCAQHQTYVS
jgi:uncharacterized protein (DUF1778 family)